MYTLGKANQKDKQRLLEILKMHTWNEKLIHEAIEIMKNHGAVEYAKRRAKDIVENAWKDVNKLLKTSKSKDELKAFVYFLIEREI